MTDPTETAALIRARAGEEPVRLGLILGSMLFNYAVGVALSSRAVNGPNPQAKAILVAGIAANLALLGYYKYANFFVDNLNALFGTGLILETIILPLAISFFTFQQIAYLVDAYRGETHEYSFLHYALFVIFFPQLIAGPIVHHREILPQFARSTLYRLKAEHLAVGLTIFALGLFKKVVLADGVAVYASPVFAAAQAGTTLTFFEAWGGALAYTFQLYFDFSGYSDMAIGLARMFGVRLPLNFNSPYKSRSISEFWTRWHISLSSFLRDNLYIPLGGNQKGPIRTYVNLFLTMLLGGLWHGANWTFVLWGAYHGTLLALERMNHKRGFGWRLPRPMQMALTFVLVMFGWVLFRAPTLEGVARMAKGLAGVNGWGAAFPLADAGGLNWALGLLGLVLVFAAKNTWEIRWRPSWRLALVLTLLFLICVATFLVNTSSPFLYFQF